MKAARISVVLSIFLYSSFAYAGENVQWFNGVLDACLGEIDRRFDEIPLYELFENDYRQFRRFCEKGLGRWAYDQQIVQDLNEWFERKFEFAARVVKRPYVVVEKNENAINYYVVPKKGQESKKPQFKARLEFTPDFFLPAFFDQQYEDVISPAVTVRLTYGATEARLKYNPVREKLRFKIVSDYHYFNLVKPELSYWLTHGNDKIEDRVESVLNFKTGAPDLHLQIVGVAKPTRFEEWEIHVRAFAFIDWEYKVRDFFRSVFLKK